jgi:DDRGK domain-containing protein 1
MRRHLIEDDLSEDEEEKKINKKEMSKMLKKQEKEELREMREQMIQDRNEKMAKKERILDEKYDQKEKERIQNEAIFKKEEENKLKQGEQEYDLWKDTFQVQEDGILDDHQTHQDLLNQFLRYIQIRKVVLLDDLAAHFDLTTNVKYKVFIPLSGYCG